jgi:hypothetical protein
MMCLSWAKEGHLCLRLFHPSPPVLIVRRQLVKPIHVQWLQGVLKTASLAT